jgi:hypothetical protein
MKLRNAHLCAALFSLPFVLAYALSAVAIAHRSWFHAPAMVRLHTHVPPQEGSLLLALVSTALLTTGATGFAMWMRNRRQRKLGVAILLLGGGLAAILIVSMRLG